MTKISDDELAQLSDEERAAIETDGEDGGDGDDKDIAALEKELAAEGKDEEAATGGDEAKGGEAAVAAEAAAAGDDKGGKEEEGKPAAGEAAAAETAAAEESTEAALELLFRAPDTSNFDAKIAELEGQRKEIRKAYRAGDIDADGYDERIDAISKQISDLEGAKREATLTERFNQDIERSRWLNTVSQYKAHVKTTEGIDYDDPVNRALEDQWDARVKALAADPVHGDKPYAWFLETAHRQVLAEMEEIAKRLGLVKAPAKTPTPDAAAAAATAAAVAKRQPQKPPVGSLATVPSAAGESPTGEFASLDSLTGEAYEMAIARLTPDQLARYEASH